MFFMRPSTTEARRAELAEGPRLAMVDSDRGFDDLLCQSFVEHGFQSPVSPVSPVVESLSVLKQARGRS